MGEGQRWLAGLRLLSFQDGGHRPSRKTFPIVDDELQGTLIDLVSLSPFGQ